MTTYTPKGKKNYIVCYWMVDIDGISNH